MKIIFIKLHSQLLNHQSHWNGMKTRLSAPKQRLLSFDQHNNIFINIIFVRRLYFFFWILFKLHVKIVLPLAFPCSNGNDDEMERNTKFRNEISTTTMTTSGVSTRERERDDWFFFLGLCFCCLHMSEWWTRVSFAASRGYAVANVN